jgi:flavorubredoxin
MKPRIIDENVLSVGAVDWDRRLFDALIPLPDGTSYNSYLVKGWDKTALIDSVDPAKAEILMGNLADVPAIDYMVSLHTEQDHSGAIPAVLAKYPRAQLICSPKAESLLIDHLGVSAARIVTVEDGAKLPLGGLTLEFAHTPWVHWPETMCAFLHERKILFSCDFFGSHVAQSEPFVVDESQVYESAKRYYAEIMMPFRTAIQKNLERVEGFPIEKIAPSHGPVYDHPCFILDAYREWISEKPKNSAVVVFVSMHGSTERMVTRLVSELANRGVAVSQFNMADTDLGKLAVALVDAATIVLAGPAVHVGAHPKIASAAFLANALRPKAKYAAVLGSFGWGQKVPEQIVSFLPNLKAEVLPPVMWKGLPKEADFKAMEALAGTIAQKHKDAGWS